MATIQIRDVPEATHRLLAERATRSGLSLSEFLRRELDVLARLPSTDEWLDEVARLEPTAGPPMAELIAEEREERELR
jgi:hypothetical protein